MTQAMTPLAIQVRMRLDAAAVFLGGTDPEIAPGGALDACPHLLNPVRQYKADDTWKEQVEDLHANVGLCIRCGPEHMELMCRECSARHTVEHAQWSGEQGEWCVRCQDGPAAVGLPGVLTLGLPVEISGCTHTRGQTVTSEITGTIRLDGLADVCASCAESLGVHTALAVLTWPAFEDGTGFHGDVSTVVTG